MFIYRNDVCFDTLADYFEYGGQLVRLNTEEEDRFRDRRICSAGTAVAKFLKKANKEMFIGSATVTTEYRGIIPVDVKGEKAESALTRQLVQPIRIDERKLNSSVVNSFIEDGMFVSPEDGYLNRLGSAAALIGREQVTFRGYVTLQEAMDNIRAVLPTYD